MKAVKVIRAIVLSPLLIVMSICLLFVALLTLNMKCFADMEDLWCPQSKR